MSRSILLSLSILFVLIISWGCEHRTYYDIKASDRYYTPKQIPIKAVPRNAGLKPEFNITRTVTINNAQTNPYWTLLGSFTHPWWGNLGMWTDTAVGLLSNELKGRGVAVTDKLPLMLRLDMVPDKNPTVLVGTLIRGCPLDADKDGVPQYLDRCPDTPQGVNVDRLGCPLDMDRDSVPDYRDHCPKIPQGFRLDNIGSRMQEPGVPEDASRDMSIPPGIFLISSRQADTVIALFKSELEREGISVTEDSPVILRFSTPVIGWKDRLKSIKEALGKEDVKITEKMPKILRISVTDASLVWEPRAIGCTLNLRVVTGEGDILDFHGTNYAIDLDDSCDGAVTKEVTAMFNNNRIRSYLAAPMEPKDSDCDGVTDEIDECPGTPLGVEVDSKGCPLDTDGDGVPDYLDECPGTPKGVKVDSRGCPIDSDGDGVPDYLDECPGTPMGVKVDHRGCPLDTDEDGVPDYKDKCPGTPRGAKVDKEGCWVIHEAFFDFDKYEIKPRFYPIFDEVVTVLNNSPFLRITIEGYTDNIGTEAYNQKLSEERAKAVMRYLVKKGIRKDRLSAVGYGFSRPRATNKTDAGRALNRRVKLEPVPKQAK